MADQGDEQAVRRLDEAWNDVYRENRRERFAEILADDFRGWFSDGRAIDKAMLMERTERRNVAFYEHDLHVFGHTAITRGRVVIEHPEAAAHQRFVRVYSKREGEWRAVAVYAFPIEPAASTQLMPADRPALVPELYVSDLDVSKRFYLDVLGFVVDYERREEGFAALRLGQAHLMLEEAASLEAATPEELAAGQWRCARLERPFGRGVNLELTVTDIDSLHARVVSAGSPMLLPPYEKRYRVGRAQLLVRQMLLADPDGYLVRPSQRIALTPG